MKTLEAWEALGVRFSVVEGSFTVAHPRGMAVEDLHSDAEALKGNWLAREWQRHLAERPLPTDDPRADLTDHAKWAAVLPLAHGLNAELFEVLHGLRCLGAQIVGGRLGCGEMTPAEYSGYRALLVPHGAMVAEVLR
jgi:hypothetical protein